MGSHIVGGAGGVVGDEQFANLRGIEGVDGTFGRRVTAEHGAVQIEQQAIMLLHKGCHVRPAR